MAKKAQRLNLGRSRRSIKKSGILQIGFTSVYDMRLQFRQQSYKDVTPKTIDKIIAAAEAAVGDVVEST